MMTNIKATRKEVRTAFETLMAVGREDFSAPNADKIVRLMRALEPLYDQSSDKWKAITKVYGKENPAIPDQYDLDTSDKENAANMAAAKAAQDEWNDYLVESVILDVDTLLLSDFEGKEIQAAIYVGLGPFMEEAEFEDEEE